VFVEVDDVEVDDQTCAQGVDEGRDRSVAATDE
jgi:hypothetical protein